jgi:hypothetical protein
MEERRLVEEQDETKIDEEEADGLGVEGERTAAVKPVLSKIQATPIFPRCRG